MKFTYENQGAVTYLVCELEPTEQIDTLALGMLTNNHIAGVAPVLYTEMNGQRFLKYNVSAKVSADQFFGGTMTRERLLLAFHNILSAVCSADEYMISQNCFALEPEHIFINVSNCETAMVCIPVVNTKDVNEMVSDLFKRVIMFAKLDSSEDASYITQLITYINGAQFNIYGLNDLVNNLRSGAAQPAAPVQPQVTVQPPVQTAPQPSAPVLSFDSTISIDDMPAMMAQKQAQQPPVQNAQPQPAIPVQNIPQPPTPQKPPVPQRPAVPVQPPVQNVQMPTPPAMHQAPAQQPPVPPMGRPMTPPAPAGKAPKAKKGAPNMNVPKPPAGAAPGFVIPGQAQPVGNQPQNQGEKKMSLFGLLTSYNKENAELYKQQKAQAKAQKAANMPAPKAKPQKAPAKPPVQPNMQQPPMQPNMPMQATPAQQNFAGRPPMAQPAQPQYAQPQFQPPVQPVPVQNSFNETTVLTPAMAGGETTVLNAEPAIAMPTLTRVKTNEKISINKPVFRIGKEKSYVDYFIADNTAISRSHANIHTENGEYFIEDTNSTNHTYINGKLINSNVKTKIVSGDKIRLANEDFTFSI